MTRTFDLPKTTFFLIAALTAGLVFFIIGFLIYTAAPVLVRSGIGFILGNSWNYETHQYGIRVLIINTIILTAISLILAVPCGILTAIFLTEWAPAWMEKILRPLIELLVGIPSVVYGLFGIFILSQIYNNQINPAISNTLGTFIPFFYEHRTNMSIGFFLTASILAVMILPTIVALAQDAMNAVPCEFREGSLALGATRWETLKGVVIPSAKPGIITGIILGMMRAMGETMVVVMLMGGGDHIPHDIFDTGEVMTSKILNDIMYYMDQPESRAALFGIAVVLFFMEIVAVAGVRYIASKTQRN